MTKCECGHESCFHRKEPKGVSTLFVQPPSKMCNAKECQCMRFTPINE